MSKDANVKIGSTLYDRIQASGLSDRERAVAVDALRNGEAIADGILSVVRAFRSAKERFAVNRAASAH